MTNQLTTEERQEIFWATLDAEQVKNEAQRQAGILQGLNALTVEHSVFGNFAALVNAPGYSPSIDCDSYDRRELADAYDQFQRSRNDERRAYRYGADRNRTAVHLPYIFGWKPELCAIAKRCSCDYDLAQDCERNLTGAGHCENEPLVWALG
jgi:hypothetical protein